MKVDSRGGEGEGGKALPGERERRWSARRERNWWVGWMPSYASAPTSHPIAPATLPISTHSTPESEAAFRTFSATAEMRGAGGVPA